VQKLGAEKKWYGWARRSDMQPELKSNSRTGLLVASAIILLWIGSLMFCLSLDLTQLSPFWILPTVLGRTFVQTGLFIVAHDAIHGSIILGNRRFNDWIGQLAVTLYAFLSYRKLAWKHWQHHRSPGQTSDPDFHDGTHHHLFAWYFKFMKGYLDGSQMVMLFLGIGITFLALQFGLQAATANLVIFWLLPIVLSSMQLFFFGTYLPHRTTSGAGDADEHQIMSSNYSLVWSFLTCYHFGYHYEHHQYPFLPWYHLPAAHQLQNQTQGQTGLNTGKPLLFNLLLGSL
jgi:beta-carotene/zeaxanthin 4-ketolase